MRLYLLKHIQAKFEVVLIKENDIKQPDDSSGNLFKSNTITMTIHPSLKLLQLAKDKLRKEFIEYWYDDWKDYLDDPDIYWIGN